jgi:hypothetical protein
MKQIEEADAPVKRKRVEIFDNLKNKNMSQTIMPSKSMSSVFVCLKPMLKKNGCFLY